MIMTRIVVECDKYLQFGPLYPADASGRIPPGQFGSEDEFGFLKVISIGFSDFFDDLIASHLMCGRIDSFNG